MTQGCVCVCVCLVASSARPDGPPPLCYLLLPLACMFLFVCCSFYWQVRPRHGGGVGPGGHRVLLVGGQRWWRDACPAFQHHGDRVRGRSCVEKAAPSSLARARIADRRLRAWSHCSEMIGRASALKLKSIFAVHGYGRWKLYLSHDMRRVFICTRVPSTCWSTRVHARVLQYLSLTFDVACPTQYARRRRRPGSACCGSVFSLSRQVKCEEGGTECAIVKYGVLSLDQLARLSQKSE